MQHSASLPMTYERLLLVGSPLLLGGFFAFVHLIRYNLRFQEAAGYWIFGTALAGLAGIVVAMAVRAIVRRAGVSTGMGLVIAIVLGLVAVVLVSPWVLPTGGPAVL